MPKTRFSGIFLAFSVRKMCFRKSCSHFRHGHFASVCKISCKNIKSGKVQLEKFKKYRVSGCSSDFQKVLAIKINLFSIEPCYFGNFLQHITRHLSAKNKKKLMNQFCTKSKKTPILGSFWPKFRVLPFYIPC